MHEDMLNGIFARATEQTRTDKRHSFWISGAFLAVSFEDVGHSLLWLRIVPEQMDNFNYRDRG